ncbi:uncharacterized protein Gm3512 isoform X2 [Mus musculus]|nr:uncharacterized protein Gm3512 isoform X2 [Mus musculus]
MNKSRAPQPAQPDIPAARIGAWERLRGAKHSLALLKPGAAGVPPSSPTLLFRRWVRKVESLISQPMTSGKNELQDHLIFISEKALHKRPSVHHAAASCFYCYACLMQPCLHTRMTSYASGSKSPKTIFYKLSWSRYFYHSNKKATKTHEYWGCASVPPLNTASTLQTESLLLPSNIFKFYEQHTYLWAICLPTLLYQEHIYTCICKHVVCISV